MNDFTLNAWLRHLIDVWDSKQNNPSICFPHLQIENGDIDDTEDLLETEETDPDREKEDRTKKKKYLGKIKYRVDYDFITSTLTVTVIECKVGSKIKIQP